MNSSSSKAPISQRAAWGALFEYYVFGDDRTAIAHVPKSRHGVLGSLAAQSIRVRRAQLWDRLKS